MKNTIQLPGIKLLQISGQGTGKKIEPQKTNKSAYANPKAQIGCAVIAQWISDFAFATRIIHFLFYLNPKCQASSILL